jgi:hypothetical protein
MPAIAPRALDDAEVTVIDGAHHADQEVAAEVKARGAAGGSARVHVHVELGDRRDIFDAMREDGIAVIYLMFTPLGLVFERQKLSVNVVVETGGRTFEGRASAEKLGSIYARARRRALADAIDKALADASGMAEGAPAAGPPR